MESQSIRTLQKKRTSNFREDETKLLIQLWGSPYIQNKLYLTHRKAPVMRILAANMQQRGFYRTPDEIKTRIRNLKCLYHRIKRTTTFGTGVGTVDPDWPHFKAMDAILSKEGVPKATDRNNEAALEGPRCEDIKQEIDIDINDDMESWATNDSIGSETSDEPAPSIIFKPTAPAKPKPKEVENTIISNTQPKAISTILPSFSIPSQNTTLKPGTMPSIPVPLLILNSLQPQQSTNEKRNSPNFISASHEKSYNDFNITLKELVKIQKENLDIEKQKLEIQKQRLEFDRLVGSQLLTLVPMIGGFLQQLAYTSNHDEHTSPRGNKRTRMEEIDIFKDSKILRTVLERGIKKYMLDEEESKESDNEEEKDDDEISQEENSNASSK